MFPTADGEDISQVTSLNRNSSPTRDARDSPEHTQVAKQNNSREFTLNMLIKEMVFCLALVLTTYGALHNKPPKVSKHPQAVRFFSPESTVTDWYMGQLSSALAYVNEADISFVMYYAPWDAESQYVRDQFEIAASILDDRVHFSAINCWNPGSECRLQHNKIPSWPILMVYTVTSRGIFYKGPRDAHSMVRFLELIMDPLKRISSTEDLVSLLSVCEAVAVGYTPLSDTSKYYSVWYQVALKTRELDVIGEICFAVVTSEELAADLGVEAVPSARLMLWNDTKEFKEGDGERMEWSETSIIHWILHHFSQPVARIIPMWKKAFSFERFVDGNPILMLFTPLNPLHEQLPMYNLLREIAMEYYTCKNNGTMQWTAELMKLQQVQRLLYEKRDINKFCNEYKFKTPVRKTSKYFKKEVVSHNNKYPWSNTTQKNQRNGFFNFLVKRGLIISKLMESSDDNSELWDTLGLLQKCSPPVLPAEKTFYENQGQCQLYEDSVDFEDQKDDLSDTETSMLPMDDDPLAPENLIQENIKHFCKVMKFASEWGPVLIPEKVDYNNITLVEGLACATNFTLNMLALDSIHNHHFAESLGIDIANKKDRTAVVILDSKHESQYVLSGPYSAKSLREFIYNFTHKKLKRSLRTHVEDAEHTHFFGSEGKTEQMGINESSVHVIDLTTKTFRKVVKMPGIVSIVAVCGGVCGAATARAVAEAGALLAACGVRTQPARLDALRHDLPWHYTANTYPTILVFYTRSRGGEPESWSYPSHVRVSSGGIVALALRALALPLRLRVRLALCNTAQANFEKKTCLRDLKEHMDTVIDRNLKYWRRSEDNRLKDAFLKRLEYLHQVSLDLSLLHISDLMDHNEKQTSLLNSLNTLSKNWEIDVPILNKNITGIKNS